MDFRLAAGVLIKLISLKVRKKPAMRGIEADRLCWREF